MYFKVSIHWISAVSLLPRFNSPTGSPEVNSLSHYFFPLIVIRISQPGPAHARTTLIHIDQLIHRGDHPMSDVAVVREGSSCVSAGAPRGRTDMKRDHGGACRPGPVARVRVPGPASCVLVLRGLQGRQSLLYRVSIGPRRPEPDSE